MSVRCRFHIALLVLLVYAFGFTAPFAAHARGLKGEGRGISCSGDCTLCGCAPARSETRTCCCWLSIKSAEHLHADTPPECCRKDEGQRESVPVLSVLPCGKNDPADPVTGTDPSIIVAHLSPPPVPRSTDHCPDLPPNPPLDPFLDPPSPPPEPRIAG